MNILSKLKICFLAGTLEHGGAERQLFYMLQALRQRDVAVRLLCLDRGQFWEAAIRSLGVPVTWVGQRRSRLGRLIRILRELRADPPDVCQSQHFFANAYLAMAGRWLGVKAIGAIRNEANTELQENGNFGGWLNLHLPRLIAANTRVAIQQAVAQGIPSSRLYFLPNVVDTQRFRPANGSTQRPLTLLAVGRVTRQKRFDRFISILGRAQERLDREVRGWIVGPEQDQGLRTELEGLAASVGLPPRCLRFLGGVSDMALWYQQADVCVLTSDSEGTPNVLLEAMASGLPVAATKVGGVPAIVRHGTTGFLADRDDLDGLAAGLVKLLSDAPLRAEMGRQARKYVEEHHALERLPAYLESLYEVALPSRRDWKLRNLEAAPV